MIAKALLHQTVCHKSHYGMIGIGCEGAVYLVKIINDSSLFFWPYISRHLGQVGYNADQFALFRIVNADVVLGFSAYQACYKQHDHCNISYIHMLS